MTALPLDPAHFHLVVNHLPVMSAPLLLPLLAIGLTRHFSELISVALAVATGLVYLTGDRQRSRWRKLPGSRSV